MTIPIIDPRHDDATAIGWMDALEPIIRTERLRSLANGPALLAAGLRRARVEARCLTRCVTHRHEIPQTPAYGPGSASAIEVEGSLFCFHGAVGLDAWALLLTHADKKSNQSIHYHGHPKIGAPPIESSPMVDKIARRVAGLARPRPADPSDPRLVFRPAPQAPPMALASPLESAWFDDHPGLVTRDPPISWLPIALQGVARALVDALDLPPGRVSMLSTTMTYRSAHCIARFSRHCLAWDDNQGSSHRFCLTAPGGWSGLTPEEAKSIGPIDHTALFHLGELDSCPEYECTFMDLPVDPEKKAWFSRFLLASKTDLNSCVGRAAPRI